MHPETCLICCEGHPCTECRIRKCIQRPVWSSIFPSVARQVFKISPRSVYLEIWENLIVQMCQNNNGRFNLHCKKELAIFPSPAGMSLTKLSLGGKKLNYSRPGRVWSVTSRLGTGKRPTLFYSVVLYLQDNLDSQNAPLYYFTGTVSQKF